jgi:hypothetical protein
VASIHTQGGDPGVPWRGSRVARDHSSDFRTAHPGALAAAKARGVKLGGDRSARLTQNPRRAGWESRMARADGKATDYAPVIAELQAAGTTSLRGIAVELNNRGIPTATGTGTWQAAQVSRVLARLRAGRPPFVPRSANERRAT